jgi:hypothetical protein
LILRAILSEKSAPISLQLFEARALRRARKLDRENALELHPSLFDRYDTVSFIIEADDRVGVDIFRPADKFAQNEFTPIVLGWGAIRERCLFSRKFLAMIGPNLSTHRRIDSLLTISPRSARVLDIPVA